MEARELLIAMITEEALDRACSPDPRACRTDPAGESRTRGPDDVAASPCVALLLEPSGVVAQRELRSQLSRADLPEFACTTEQAGGSGIIWVCLVAPLF